MPFGFKFEVPELPPEIGEFREIVREESLRAAGEASVQLRAELVEASPVGGTVLLRNSWIAESPESRANEVSAKVVSSAPQALIVEEGARRHFPPTAPGLSQWVRRKLGIEGATRIRRTAFRIARAISRRGLRARRVFAQAVEAAGPTIDATFERMGERIQARTGGG